MDHPLSGFEKIEIKKLYSNRLIFFLSLKINWPWCQQLNTDHSNYDDKSQSDSDYMKSILLGLESSCPKGLHSLGFCILKFSGSQRVKLSNKCHNQYNMNQVENKSWIQQISVAMFWPGLTQDLSLRYSKFCIA